MTDYLRDLLDNWSDDYWRADHPEVVAVAIAVATGLIGLGFAWLESQIPKQTRIPEARNV
jgi:hypothetical protein